MGYDPQIVETLKASIEASLKQKPEQGASEQGASEQGASEKGADANEAEGAGNDMQAGGEAIQDAAQ